MRQTPVLAVLPVLALLALPGAAPAQGRVDQAKATCAAELATIGVAAFVQKYADDEVQDAARRCVARYRHHPRRSDRGRGADADRGRRQGEDRSDHSRADAADQRRRRSDDRSDRGRGDEGHRHASGDEQRARPSAERADDARNAD
jgi:hypothetical protein